MTALISIPEASDQLRRTPRSVTAEALRRHAEIPVYIQPEPPGWRAVLHRADAGGRIPAWAEHYPGEAYDVLLAKPILLTPDVLRDVLATGWLKRVTIDGMTTATSREEVGYAAWSMDAKGEVTVDPDSAITKLYCESYRLCEPQQVPLDALQISLAAVSLLRGDVVATGNESPVLQPEKPVGTNAVAETLGLDPRTLAGLAEECLGASDAPQPPLAVLSLNGYDTPGHRRNWRWWLSDVRPWLQEVTKWRASLSQGDAGRPGRAKVSSPSAGGTGSTPTRGASSSASSSEASDHARRPKRSAKSSTRKSPSRATGGPLSGAESKLAELLKK